MQQLFDREIRVWGFELQICIDRIFNTNYARCGQWLTGTRPDPILIGYTRSVPDIFSESSGISGIGYYKKVGFSMRPISFFNGFFIKMMPIFKMSPNFWPVSLWNCICGIFCTSIWTIHNNWNFKTINPKNSTELKEQKITEILSNLWNTPWHW